MTGQRTRASQSVSQQMFGRSRRSKHVALAGIAGMTQPSGARSWHRMLCFTAAKLTLLRAKGLEGGQRCRREWNVEAGTPTLADLLASAVVEKDLSGRTDRFRYYRGWPIHATKGIHLNGDQTLDQCLNSRHCLRGPISSWALSEKPRARHEHSGTRLRRRKGFERLHAMYATTWRKLRS